jgi:hypothetical protein
LGFFIPEDRRSGRATPAVVSFRLRIRVCFPARRVDAPLYGFEMVMLVLTSFSEGS